MARPLWRKPIAKHFATSLFLAGVLCSGSTLALDINAQLRALLPATGQNPTPGCALATFQDGQITHLVSNGYASLDTLTPLSGETLFYAASISKQFTALAIMQLVLQGRLDFDGDIRIWLPELPPHPTPITPRMLLQHSSGILDSLSLVRLSSAPGMAGSTSREQTLSLVLAQNHTNFPPGTKTQYSNGAYLVASELIQRASGMPYALYVKHHILEPMGMHDSYMLDGAPHESPQLAHGYAVVGAGYEARDTFPRYGGSGGLMLTLNDLARYEYDIEHGHRVWSAEIRKLMEAPGKLEGGTPAYVDGSMSMAYALGIKVGERNGRRIIEHGGGAEAFRHAYSRAPDARTAVAVFCNHVATDLTAKADAAITLLLGATQAELDRPPVTGVYRAQTLPVHYVLFRISDDEINVNIVPDGNDLPSDTIRLFRQNNSRVFSGSGIELEVLDIDTVIFSTNRACGLHANRLQTE